MLIFCALTQFLLLTIIICLLSNSLEKVRVPYPETAFPQNHAQKLMWSSFDRSWSMPEMSISSCECRHADCAIPPTLTPLGIVTPFTS